MSPSTGDFKLPQEIIDHIIDLTHTDRATLRRVSLTSHAWVERCQHHLLQSVRIVDGDPSHWHFRHNFAAFHRFLQHDASARFCAQVRHLSVQGDQGSYDFPSRMLLDRTLFPLVLEKLARLRTLSVCDVRFEGVMCPVPKRFRLEELVMTSVGSYKDSPRDIVNFLDMFEEIGALRTSFVDSWYEAALERGEEDLLGDFVSQEGRLPFAIRDAHIRGWTTVNCLLNIMQHSHSVSTLQSLHVECTDKREVASVGHLIRNVGKNLRHVNIDLSIAFRDEQDPQTIADMLSLHAAPALESLHICVFPNMVLPLASSTVHIARSSACLLQILSSLSPTVRRVTVELGPSDIVHDRVVLVDWEALAYVRWEQFEEFERLRILLRRGASVQVVSHIREKLKALEEKKFLSVEGDQVVSANVTEVAH